MSRATLFVSLLVLLSACGSELDHQASDDPAITLCVNGAGGANHPGNAVVTELCEQLPGLIRACPADDDCRATFRFTETTAAADALASTILARRGAGQAIGPVSLVGYSYGAVNIVEQILPTFLANQSVDQNDRVIDRVVLIDPFRPLIADPLKVPLGVRHVWSYRHSVAPPDDCSARPLQRGYQGAAISCLTSSRCLDYDFTLIDEAVDHCTVTDRARPAALTNILTGADERHHDLPAPRDAAATPHAAAAATPG